MKLSDCKIGDYVRLTEAGLTYRVAAMKPEWDCLLAWNLRPGDVLLTQVGIGSDCIPSDSGEIIMLDGVRDTFRDMAAKLDEYLLDNVPPVTVDGHEFDTSCYDGLHDSLQDYAMSKLCAKGFEADLNFDITHWASVEVDSLAKQMDVDSHDGRLIAEIHFTVKTVDGKRQVQVDILQEPDEYAVDTEARDLHESRNAPEGKD